jgi:hypothetical protein
MLLGSEGHAALENTSWQCTTGYRIRGFVETEAGLGSEGGPPGRHRFRSTFSEVALTAAGSAWSLSSAQFGSLSGTAAVLNHRSYIAAGTGQVTAEWVHERILAETRNWDLSVTGSTLLGLFRLDSQATRLRGRLKIAYTAEAPTELFVGSVTINLQCGRA